MLWMGFRLPISSSSADWSLVAGIKMKIAGSLKSMVLAALFGLITYATCDLTNLATLKDWPVLLSVVDMLWGTVLSVSVSAIGYIAGKRIR